MVMSQEKHRSKPSTTTTKSVRLFGQDIVPVVPQPSMAVKNEVVVHRYYSNGLNQDEDIAMALCHLKNTPIDRKTSAELERMVRRLSVRHGEIAKPARTRTGVLKIEPQEELNMQEEEVLGQLRSFGPAQMPAIPGISESMIGAWSGPFWKQLTESDVKDNQSRLSVSKADAEECIFPMLDPETEDPVSGIEVVTYNLFGEGFKMIFKTWGNGKMIVLTGGWKEFYRKHSLGKMDHFVFVWVFRRADTGQLCFLVTWKKIPGVVHPISRKLLRGD